MIDALIRSILKLHRHRRQFKTTARACAEARKAQRCAVKTKAHSGFDGEKNKHATLPLSCIFSVKR